MDSDRLLLTTLPPPPTAPSPARVRAEALLEKRNPAVGSVIASAKAADYVAVLDVFVNFRGRHEFEPLHEDLLQEVCGEDPTREARDAFAQDIQQLMDWGLVSRRIEKERVRGYRDNRRQKFRYRICDDAVALVEWLRALRDDDLHPRERDVGNILDSLLSLLQEIHRRIHKLPSGTIPYENAGDLLYRLQRISDLTDEAVRSLQLLDIRLLSFAASSYDIAEARALIGELDTFVNRFLVRVGRLRQAVAPEFRKLLESRYEARWHACEAALRAEAEKMRRLTPVRVPDARADLRGLAAFYDTEGELPQLMHRVATSARAVWRKLSAHLRELERRNHRMEDLRARLGELAALPEESVPHGWLTGLIESAAMRGDSHIRPDVRSRAPQPARETQRQGRRIEAWIDRHDDGGRAPAVSIERQRLEELADWLRLRGLMPETGDEPRAVSRGVFSSDEDDLRRILETARSVLLGGGSRAARIGLAGDVSPDEPAAVEIGDRRLRFQELRLRRKASAHDRP